MLLELDSQMRTSKTRAKAGLETRLPIWPLEEALCSSVALRGPGQTGCSRTAVFCARRLCQTVGA